MQLLHDPDKNVKVKSTEINFIQCIENLRYGTQSILFTEFVYKYESTKFLHKKRIMNISMVRE